ncbi:MAG: hypothetical protein NVS4B12_19820 [Ktedonobacteraceae bacterium]
MNEETALTTIVESSTIDLAISGWVASHKKSPKTLKAYATTIQQFRAGLQRMGKDLDTDVQTIILLAQAFAAATVNAKKTARREHLQRQVLFHLAKPI